MQASLTHADAKGDWQPHRQLCGHHSPSCCLRDSSLCQGTGRHSSSCKQEMHLPVKTAPTIVCQGSCCCYEHLILDGLGLYQDCSKANTFRQGGMIMTRKGEYHWHAVLLMCPRQSCTRESHQGSFQQLLQQSLAVYNKPQKPCQI